MTKFVRVRVHGAIQVRVLIMVYSKLLGWGPSNSLSIDRDLDTAENVKALRSTLVMLNRARAPFPAPYLEPPKLQGSAAHV